MLLTAVLVSALAQVGSGNPLLPCGVSFECATDVKVANATATWKFSFDRRYAGIYDIVHWRIEYTAGKPVEYLAHLESSTGGRPRYWFFVRERRGVWYTLGIHKRSVWRQVPRASPEQNVMVVRLRHMFGVVQALRDGTDPRSLKF
jgi:hypothetical protein